jgi:hypothetical protein
MKLDMASETDLTGRMDRGVAPVDAPLSSARSRRSRRVAYAAISTRNLPLVVCSGDQAASCWCLVFTFGEAYAFRPAATDFDLHGRI